MPEGCRRLAPGLVAILAAAGLLLAMDGRRRTGSTAADSPRRVAILQMVAHVAVDQVVAGTVAELDDRGWTTGRNLELAVYNAHGDMTVANAVAREVVDSRPDIAVTVTTPMTQIFARANQRGDVVQVFGMVTDPWAAGLGIDPEEPTIHPPHLLGCATPPPAAELIESLRLLFPSLRRVGILYNPGEANSVASVATVRATCRALGLVLFEAQVETPVALTDSTDSLIARGAECLVVTGDNTVESGIQAVYQSARRAGIPVMLCVPAYVRDGAYFCYGVDMDETGRNIGRMAAGVLGGMIDPATFAIQVYVPAALGVNLQVQKTLKGPWRVPEDMLARAAVVIGPDGHERSPTPQAL